MATTPRFHVFFFADGTKLISDEPITKAMARRAHGLRAEPVRAARWNPMLRSAIAAARAAGKFPPALSA
ncbi:hypothetical protein ACRQ5Q_14825 [Bradyrhizobium sp. PMVTL-01]|uniref:hypothetical protein n=1 Tax=Bradyrhizobium sp. PMVTL-01 TaxID=3434999 RepID=UPI003F72514D